MIRVTAYPTIEWLQQRATRRAADRGPLRTSHFTAVTLNSIPRKDARVARALKQVLKRGVRVSQNQWITTPDGEQFVDLILEAEDGRIALSVSSRYERINSPKDALVLVYGGFQALYRYQVDDSDQALHDLIYGIMRDHPSFFSNYGHLMTERKASPEIKALDSPMTGIPGIIADSDRLHIRRMRLCCATEWVESFESALDEANRYAKGA